MEKECRKREPRMKATEKAMEYTHLNSVHQNLIDTYQQKASDYPFLEEFWMGDLIKGHVHCHCLQNLINMCIEIAYA